MEHAHSLLPYASMQGLINNTTAQDDLTQALDYDQVVYLCIATEQERLSIALCQPCCAAGCALAPAPWLVQPPTLGASALLHLHARHTLHTHHTVKILNVRADLQVL